MLLMNRQAIGNFKVYFSMKKCVSLVYIFLWKNVFLFDATVSIRPHGAGFSMYTYMYTCITCT